MHDDLRAPDPAATRVPGAGVPDTPPGDGFLARLVAVFAAPGKAMAWVRAQPRWLVAGLVIMVVSGLFAAATMHIAGPEQLEIMKETRLGQMMGPEQLAEQLARAENPTPLKRVTQFVSGAAGVWVATFIAGLVFLLFTRLAGGAGTFKQVMGVVFWAGIISAGLGALVRLPLVLAKGSVVEVSTGLGVLVEPDPLSLPFQLLSIFDVFSLWALAVTTIGFEKVHGFTRGKAAVVTVVPWLLMSFVMLGITRAFI